MRHEFTSRLRRGDPLIGTIVTINSSTVVELLARCGFDWLFLDGEHAPLGAADLQHLVQAAGDEMPCVVRVPSSDEVFIKQALDIGAAGIIVPQVNTAEQAESVVRFAKYSPEGMRGVGLARAHGYGMDFAKYINNANHDTAVIVQAEHAEAVKNIDAIVKVEGVDAVLVGPYDLSASLGKIGQVEDPEVVHAISQVTEACAAASMPLGLFAVAATSLEPYIKRGYTLLVAGVDTLLLGQAETSLLNEVKGLIGSR